MDKQALPKVLLSLFDTASEGFWFMNDNNVVQLYNRSFYQQFHISSDCSTLEDWLVLVHPEDRKRLAQEIETHQQEQTSTNVTTRYRVKSVSGCYLWIEATGMIVEWNGEFAMIGSHRNVSEKMFLNQYLSHMLSHDSETGLFNRYQFLKNASCLNEEGWVLVFCLTQLQDFQRRNGQDATRHFSSILVSTLDDVLNLRYGLYRISADVFVVTIEQALAADMVLSLMNQIESLFHQDGVCSVTRTGRVGLGALPVRDMNFTHSLDKIFNLSEYARMVSYPVIYTGDLQRDIDRHFAIQDALEAAIETHQITIALQPIVEASTGNLMSFEALARWVHPALGSISPKEFIPMAERLGHIHALGMVVFAHACHYLAMFDEKHQSTPLVNVNVSAHQLIKECFVGDVLDVVTQFDLLPNRIVLEVTESYLLDEDPTITTTLNVLHAHGFKLSIDDFGSGMSAITSLFRLPLYQIKLDRMLINEAMRFDACLKLVAHLCELGRSHNITLVAEGVETTTMVKKLIGIGVPYLQGFFLYKPCPPNVWLQKNALF